jgi:hypothetical protein
VKKLKSGISFFLSACIMIAILCPITAANGADVNTTASVSQLAARHYEGQTILTWNEILKCSGSSRHNDSAAGEGA